MATKTKAKTKTTRTSGASLLSGMAGSQPATTKSNTPVVLLTTDDQKAKLQAIIDAKVEEKRAIGLLKMAQDAFRPEATELYEAQCRADNLHHSSVKLTGGGKQATFTQQSRLLPMKEAEVGDDMHRIFGDQFDEFFGLSQTLSLKADLLEDAEIVKIIRFLQKLLPEDRYKSVVGVQSIIKAKPRYYSQRILNPAVKKLAVAAETEGLAKPWGASFK